MPYSYILGGGCRTPIGKLLGSLSHATAPELGATAIASAVSRAGVAPEAVEEVVMGIVLTAGVGQAPARQAALAAGLSDTTAALSINKVCGSGLKSVMLADQAIRAGDASCIVAGGMESMSRAPYLLARGARSGYKFGHRSLIDSMLHDGLWCAMEDEAMGDAAEYIASKHGVSRTDQDAYAAESHRRAAASVDAFTSEIVAVPTPQGGEAAAVLRDEGPRPETTADRLAKLPPAYSKDGTVTAGNASQISDGAAALVVTSESLAADTSSHTATARILATATAGVAPRELFIAPVTAIQRVLAKTSLKLNDLEVIELNEAFAAQSLACMRALRLDADKVNIRGGAIALGHPIGASGARVLVTLLHAMAAGDAQFGLASLCLGGGNAVAMIVERV